MSYGHVLYQMVKADFLERVRRYSFLVTLVAALYLGYAVIAEKVWIVLGAGYRGLYNSAWIGAVTAICCSTFFSLAGFYVVKNSVQRDIDTRVGQILAATPMRKTFYTLAKTLSNFAVLGAMVAVLMLAALGMQWFHAEVPGLSLWELWSPFLLLTLPVMALTAAVAVLFETVPGLRGGVGNVAYFFVWMGGLVLGAVSNIPDPYGIEAMFNSTRAALAQIDPTSPRAFALTMGGQHAVHTFLWNGFAWTPDILLGRIFWVAVATAFALLAAVFFHRFDPAHEGFIRKGLANFVPLPGDASDVAPMPAQQAEAAQLTPLAVRRGSAFLQLVVAELRLMLKGQRWWWYAVAAGLLIGSATAPDAGVREMWLVFAWVWPVLLWSQMGAREARNATQALIFSSARSLHRQLPAVWLAGVLLAMLTGAGVGLRLLLSGAWPSLAAWFAGALFIPSLALALGVWTGSGKAFEALYTVWWYMGPLHNTPGMDFVGTTARSSTPSVYLVLAAVLVTVAYVGRRVRLAYV